MKSDLGFRGGLGKMPCDWKEFAFSKVYGAGFDIGIIASFHPQNFRWQVHKFTLIPNFIKNYPKNHQVE